MDAKQTGKPHQSHFAKKVLCFATDDVRGCQPQCGKAETRALSGATVRFRFYLTVLAEILMRSEPTFRISTATLRDKSRVYCAKASGRA